MKGDNRSPFDSFNFKLFTTEFGFPHHKITPLWPEANGEAEWFIRMFTKVIKALHIEGTGRVQCMDGFLMCYRETPHAM